MVSFLLEIIKTSLTIRLTYTGLRKTRSQYWAYIIYVLLVIPGPILDLIMLDETIGFANSTMWNDMDNIRHRYFWTRLINNLVCLYKLFTL